jgi:hypothetical protein
LSKRRAPVTAKGGADTVTVNETDVNKFNLDLAGVPGGSGDGATNTIVINATSGDDVIQIAGDAKRVSILSPPG